MPRENSFSDSDGRSLTPDLDEENDFDMGPGALTGSPVADNTLGAFNYPPNNAESTANNTAPPTVSFREPQQQSPPLADVYSSTPARKATGATVRTTNGTPARPNLPLERFRASVRKVIHMKRGSSAMSLGGAGAEPGIDPRRSSAYLNYGHIRAKCSIDIVDYSTMRSSFGRMQNKGFVEFMEDPKAFAREPWVRVRWINIGGISWDVISSLAIALNLHPLALEDVLHNRAQARSKADYYIQHLFIRVLRHTLAPEDEEILDDPGSITQLPRSSSPDSMLGDVEDEEEENEKKRGSSEADEEDKTLAGSRFSTKKVGTFRKASAARDVEMGQTTERGRPLTTASLMRRSRNANVRIINRLRRGERVNVKVQPLCIFLLRDGTVISINRDTNLDFTAPILARLRQRDTVLRTSADASLLVQSLLDVVVDQAMEVVEEYQHKILKLEHDVLIKPSMKSVRYLHMISGDLTLHKRTLEPIKTLVYGLRRYDVDRCVALINSQGMDVVSMPKSLPKVDGFMSHKAKIYLADVYDHMDYIIGSFDMFSNVAENLINFTFNMASYEMNNVMRRLTLATIIFLPLTLLTGYFGMNFEAMWSVQQNSDVLFWEIALPVMVIVVPIFMWNDILQGAHYMKKKWMDRKIRKSLGQDIRKKNQ